MEARPRTVMPCCSSRKGRNASTTSGGQIRARRRVSSMPGSARRATRPPSFRVKPTPGLARMSRYNRSCARFSSVAGLLRNFRRAGTLANSSRTSATVPPARAAGPMRETRPKSTSRLVASPYLPEASRGAETMRKRETEAILGSASPRKPKELIRERSSMPEILLVACRVTASSSSAAGMPRPSSVTRTMLRPPSSSSTSMREAPASRLFSTSSLSTLAGRSTTSPAAIWLASSGGRRRICLRGDIVCVMGAY